MTPVILRVFKNDQLVEVKQFETNQVLIGSEGDVGLLLQGEGISALHCLIEKRESGYYLSDLGSQSGTFKNTKQVLDEAIGTGESFHVGPFRVQFFLGPPTLAEVVEPPVVKPTPAKKVTSVTAGVAAAASAASVFGVGTPAKATSPAPSASKPTPAPSKTVLSKKSPKTFAPPGHVVDLKDYLSPGKGNVIEVLVAWKERVLETYHFPVNATKTVTMADTRTADIFLPGTNFKTVQPFLLIQGGACQIHTLNADAVHIKKADETVAPQGVSSLKIDQNEMICLSYCHGEIQVFVRYTAGTATPLFAPLLDFSSGELTGLVVSLMIVGLAAIYIAMIKPSVEEQQKEEPQRLAQFIYTKTIPPPPEAKEEKPPEVKPPPPTPPPPTPPPKKVQVTDEKKVVQKKGNKESTAEATERPATKAAEVRPNPNNNNRPKKFTSVKQGGAVKLSDANSANAQSTKDVNKTGLLSAFGNGGSRSKLDQAYSGQGDLIGMADRSTGTSGQNENRAGDDLGSKFKDSGAGGKGTATQGIAGVGTKGRGSGQTTYGGLGVGGKGAVSIDASGSDAEFVGSIDREAVRRVIRSILSEIKSCYERQLRSNSSLEGKVVIQFEIEEQGRVRVAKTKSSSLNSSEVESCVASRIKEQRFPEPPSGVTAVVDFPFVFGAQK